jgi:HK97 family phage prohead protease
MNIYEGKALPVTELEDGDLLLEGMAAVWHGVDAQLENFTPGAFEHSTKAFLAGSAPLCFNHKSDHVLGKILDLKVTPEGLFMKARVDSAVKHTPHLRTLFEQIRKGTLTGLSVGGIFGRTNTPLGPRINQCRIMEISTTAIPMHETPAFAVVSGKALQAETLLALADDLGWLRRELREREWAAELEIARLRTGLAYFRPA